MENVEKKTLFITKLEEQVTELNEMSKQKHVEIEKLQNRLKEAETEISNMALAKVSMLYHVKRISVIIKNTASSTY